jgi:hypothetical protein
MTSDVRLSPRTRRMILSQLARDRLAEITTRFDVYVQDRRSTAVTVYVDEPDWQSTLRRLPRSQ